MADASDERLQCGEAAAQSDVPQFFIVGVGASAGGLEALGALVKQVDLSSMALVAVQHLDPTHESLLASLLARASNIEVLAAQDGMTVEPNHIYVIQPNTNLAILNGVLQVLPIPAGQSPRMPVDFFFRSLADDQGGRAIGVVLSGTGSDGTFGLRAIKEAGGITFAQDPETARYDGMPRSALDSGFADFCLPVEGIADQLMTISQHPYLARVRQSSPPGQAVAKLLLLIRTSFGHDLTQYKTSTIERRIERRMALAKLERLDDYVQLVQNNPGELRLLYKDMLINVTSFFRDGEPFEALKREVFPTLLARKRLGTSIRIWVPACSTGEEAYSIAISLLEFLDGQATEHAVQIFGTDVDEESIQYARRGAYPHNIALDVSAERLSRFFVKDETCYQINRRVRDLVVFSTHNIIKDAPFSHLDLVSCRNLLIYLQPQLQKRVLRVLHYALTPGGFLLLGNSETVGDSADLFALVDRTNKTYACKHVASASLEVGFGTQQMGGTPPSIAERTRPVLNLAALAERKILDRYGPPGVVVNERLDVVHFRGRISPYLEPASGSASLNVLRLARPELHADLRRILHQALTENAEATVTARLHDGGKQRSVRIEAIPVADPETRARCLLVLFHEEAPPEAAPEPAPDRAPSPDGNRLADLERELAITKDYLQNTIADLEGTNEELKSANEELQSSNEELQSTNEELETSKEELQSTNEELTTVNDELHSRMSELQQTSDDLHNVLSGVDNPVVIVGMDLRIRRFTSAAERILNLVAADIGRSVTHLNSFVGKQRLDELTSQVINTLAPVEIEILGANGRWYQMRIRPYKTLDHTIKGAVIVLADIDIAQRAGELGRNVGEYASKFLGIVEHPLMIIDRDLRVLWVNDAFYAAFQVVAEETLGNLLPRVGAGQWNRGDLLEAVAATAATGTPFRDLEVTFAFPDVGKKTIRVGGSRIPVLREAGVILLLSFEGPR